MVQKGIKAGTKRVKVTLTSMQLDEINGFVGLLGSNTSDVIKFVITDWLNKQRSKKGDN